MNCICNESEKHSAGCACDSFRHPPRRMTIGAGLSDLPRQIGSFTEFRRAMLADIRGRYPLELWQAKQPDDLGVMLLEMWAYICDSLSFYDKVIAQEEYIRTALRRPSLRKLAALLGYLPGPALASSVYLAAQADGRRLLKLPAGTAFSSGGFDGLPPQIFELTADVFIHPLTNQWHIKAPHIDRTSTADPVELLILDSAGIKAGTAVFLRDIVNHGNSQVIWIRKEEPYTGADGKKYRRLLLEFPTELPVNYPFSNLKLFMPTQTAGVVDSKSGEDFTVTLDAVFREIQIDDFVLISRGAYQTRWFQVKGVRHARHTGSPFKVTINENDITVPGISVMATRLILDAGLNQENRKNPLYTEAWNSEMNADFTVHFAMQIAGTITGDTKTLLSDSDEMLLEPKPEEPSESFRPDHFLLKDKNTRGERVDGSLDFPSGKFLIDLESGWLPDMVLPVELFGNSVKVSRGETVPYEILGNGNATLSGQTFKLKKKPLTYLPAPIAEDDRGLQNTLAVYVNGVKWKEVPTFYNTLETEEIYIVRQNDEGETMVIFGDGVRGSRLPNGVDNITATYRFGAGKAAPPPGSVNQISKPVTGLRSVSNPLPAYGGEDAEHAGRIRTNAPSSVLILGRAVSIQDMEAVLLSMPGVFAVQAQWRWHSSRQIPIVHIWYIGEDGIHDDLNDRLKNITDPSVPFVIKPAVAVPASLEIELIVSPRYIIHDITAALQKLLTEEETGLLSMQKIGIGQPLFISRIFEAADSVPGIIAVSHILWDGTVFTGFARDPEAGGYFSFAEHSIIINGTHA